MKRITYDGKDKFYFENFNNKRIGKDEVAIKTKVLGLCGSDIQKFLKQTPTKGYLKTKILGHEIMGEVINIGSDISNIKIGDRVVINPFNVKDKKHKSESFSFDKNIDIVGRTINGGYSEIIYMPKNCVYKIPNTISDYEGIFIDDIAVALHGIHYIEQYNAKTENIAIIGDGPLGLLCYRILKSKYSNSNIILFSRNTKKIDKLNINYVAFDKIEKFNDKFDVVIEAVGGKQADTLNSAISIGSYNCLILGYGVYQFGYKPELNIRNLLYKQGVLKGINSYCNKYNDFEDAIKLLKDKKINVDDLITSRVSFENAIEYIKEYNSTKDNIKTVFEVK